MVFLVNTFLLNSLIRTIVLVALCIWVFSTALRADILEDYLDSNPEVSVFSLNVGSSSGSCAAATCPSYSSVELEVPEYVHSNLVTDIPVIRNGLNDVVIASIDPEIGVIKLRTKNTVNDINDELPLKDGDKIDILYVNEHDESVSSADGDQAISIGSAQQITPSNYIESRRQDQAEPKQVDPRKVQIDRVKKNLPGLDPVTIDIAINILKNEFQSSPRYEDQNFREKIIEKVNLIGDLMSSGELVGYDIERRYPRLKFFNELNDLDKSDLTDEELVFLQQVNRDLENLSSSIMRKSPEVLIKGLYKKLLRQVEASVATEPIFPKDEDKASELSFSEHIFLADMIKRNFDEVFGNYLDKAPEYGRVQKKYHPKLIDPNFLNERLRLQEEVILYLSLFREEVLENEEIMESFSDELDPGIGLTLVELEERYNAKNLIDKLIFINEEARLKGFELLETNLSIEEGFGTSEIIKNVNFILEKSIDDILFVIDQEVNQEQRTFWENLRDFLELPNFNDNSGVSFGTVTFDSFDNEDGEISEKLGEVLQKRQELQDLAAIAAVMGYPVLGPP